MVLDDVAAQAICVALVAADQLTKTWRIQILARGLGYRIRFRPVFTFNVASDAASTLTPLRMGGEPVRFAGIMETGLTVADTIALITVEGSIEYTSVIAIAAYLGSTYAGEWWRTVSARLVPAMHRVVPWIGIVIMVGVGLWIVLRRAAPRLFVHVHGTLRDSWRNTRRIAPWAVGASVPLTLIHVLARIAILPVLMATLPAAPAAGVVWFGSFALLYGQLVLPTPSGAGAVEIGFLNGVAGYAGPGVATILVWWRFYTAVTGVILGVMFGVPHYAGALRRWLVRRRVAREAGRHGPSA